MSANGRVKILVVDDSIGVQNAARDALASLDNTEIVCVGDAETAERWLGNHQPALVLCDVVLPDRNGYDLCRHVKETVAGCPVLLLSSPFEPFDEGESRLCGAEGIAGKPFTAGELRERVTALLVAHALPAVDAAPAHVLDETPTEEIAEVSEADLVDARGAPGATAEDIAARLLEPLADRLIEPVARRLLDSWQRGALPETVARRVADAAERLVRERLQEIEDEATRESFVAEDND